MHIHILGICGTFMGGIAVIARRAGHKVTGCDANVYPPMSTQLQAQSIELIEGFDPAQIENMALPTALAKLLEERAEIKSELEELAVEDYGEKD